MPLEIQIQQNLGGQKTGAVTVKLTGSLDTTTAPELERRLSPVLAGPVKDLVFDLAELKFLLSDGFREFMKARNRLKQRGGQLAFVNLQPQIKEVFEVFGSLPRQAIFESHAELDAYLTTRQRSYEKSN
jgi:anti-anti-sigma factor